MPLTLPNLDDRTYDDLVAEAYALIPSDAPEWTNHNPSDPGITLIELFAYLTEMLIYRVNRVTDANRVAFLRLLNGPDWKPSSVETLTQQIREAVLELREPNRAITCEDFERLARDADSQVARARCLPRRNLESESSLAPAIEKPGHVSVMIVPRGEAVNPQPSAGLIKNVRDYLELRRLLTTQVHVVGPRYFAFGVRLTLALKPDAVAEIRIDHFTLDSSLQTDLNNATFSLALRQAFVENKPQPILFSPNVSVEVQVADSLWLIRDNQTDQRYLVRNESGALNVYEDTARIAVIKTLKQFFDPLTGGEDGEGWQFGRNVYVSEIFKLLDTQPGIDYVTKTIDPNDPQKKKLLDEFTADGSRLLRNAQGDLVAVEIKPDELIDVHNMIFDLTIQ